MRMETCCTIVLKASMSFLLIRMVGPVRVRAGRDADRGVRKEVGYNRARTRSGSRPVVPWSGSMVFQFSFLCAGKRSGDGMLRTGDTSSRLEMHILKTRRR